MYVILTSKPAQFRTEWQGNEAVRPVEAFDYFFYGRQRARFVIAELCAETRLRQVDVTPPETINWVPTRLLEHFDSVDRARAELQQLCRAGDAQSVLHPLPLQDLQPL